MKYYIADDIAAHFKEQANWKVSRGDPMDWVSALPANLNQPVAGGISDAQLPAAPVGTEGTLADMLAGVDQGWYRFFGKRVLDVLFVIATLPVSLPVILFCVISLWIEGGKPIYRQERLGKGGRRFIILKLRTMVSGADDLLAACLKSDPALRDEWEATQKLKKDPRITGLGVVLRATSLDELPQLWNVLIGDMSIVGPRPMMPEQLPLYGDTGAYFALRPGITGDWQVSARNTVRFSDRAGMDAQYFRDMSFRRDLVLLLKTIGVMLRRTGH